ncbi:DUF2335 domain-containing protein [Pontibacter ummariensis]|nr:DUF2335 domain-containing protein [Pontibacter ummariensis]
MSQQKFHAGPIPSAEELARLEQVSPGLALEVINMAKKEQDHRHETNQTLVDAEVQLLKDESRLKFRGQWMTLFGIVLTLGLCAYGFYLGFDSSAATITVSVIVALVGAFAFSRQVDKDKEKEEKK